MSSGAEASAIILERGILESGLLIVMWSPIHKYQHCEIKSAHGGSVSRIIDTFAKIVKNAIEKWVV
jgi:hypothetical protein